MKHLIVYAHPIKQSLNGYFKTTLEEYLIENHEVEVRDLYQLNFNPVLSVGDMAGQRKGEVCEDVKKEQGYIVWADCITFIYPIWWTGMPAMMKGYIDRVFSYGFAYRYDSGIQKGMLKGKQVTIINTHGKSDAEYSAIGMDKALSLTLDTGIYIYCGLEINKHFFFDQADRADEERISDWEKQIKEIY